MEADLTTGLFKRDLSKRHFRRFVGNGTESIDQARQDGTHVDVSETCITADFNPQKGRALISADSLDSDFTARAGHFQFKFQMHNQDKGQTTKEQLPGTH